MEYSEQEVSSLDALLRHTFFGLSHDGLIETNFQYGKKDPIQLAFSDQSITGKANATRQKGSSRIATESHSYHLTAAKWGTKQIAYVPHQFPKTAQVPDIYGKLESMKEIKTAEKLEFEPKAPEIPKGSELR